MIARFLKQPNRAHRNMHIVLGLLGLHFLVASLTYVFDPLGAMAQFRRVGELVGHRYMVSEYSHVWRVLAAGNVFTLAFLCFAIQANPKRHWPMVPVFVVMKSFAAIGFLLTFFTAYRYAPFLGVFVWDGFNVFLVWFFASRARRAIEIGGAVGEASLVPRLFFEPRA